MPSNAVWWVVVVVVVVVIVVEHSKSGYPAVSPFQVGPKLIHHRERCGCREHPLSSTNRASDGELVNLRRPRSSYSTIQQCRRASRGRELVMQHCQQSSSNPKGGELITQRRPRSQSSTNKPTGRALVIQRRLSLRTSIFEPSGRLLVIQRRPESATSTIEPRNTGLVIQRWPLLLSTVLGIRSGVCRAWSDWSFRVGAEQLHLLGAFHGPAGAGSSYGHRSRVRRSGTELHDATVLSSSISRQHRTRVFALWLSHMTCGVQARRWDSWIYDERNFMVCRAPEPAVMMLDAKTCLSEMESR